MKLKRKVPSTAGFIKSISDGKYNKPEVTSGIRWFRPDEDKIRAAKFTIITINELQLAIPLLPRQVKKQLAKKYNVKWETYSFLYKEIQRRIKENLNLETGEPPVKEELNEENNAVKEEIIN